MTSTRDSGDMYSAFLSLPTEIRCEIYGHLLAESQAITISAGYTTVFGHRIQDRARKHNIPGLPLDLAPLVRHTRDASLLSATNPPEIPLDNVIPSNVASSTDTLGMSAPLALLLSCRQVNDELTDFKRGRKQINTMRARLMNPDALEDDPVAADDKEGLALYVTYPYGVLVLKSMYPYLLKQARRVYISGYYASPAPTLPTSTSSSFDAAPSHTFAVAESFGAPTSGRSFLNASRLGISRTRTRSAPYDASRPRLRLDPPRPSRTTTPTQSFPPIPPSTHDLAPLALAHLVRTLFPATPSACTLLCARIMYPGDNAYAAVWSDADSPVSHILRSVYGGKIDMKVKRGNKGTGVGVEARPKTDGRNVSTGWESWKGEVDGWLVRVGEEDVKRR
jgi:hypothetical protein